MNGFFILLIDPDEQRRMDEMFYDLIAQGEMATVFDPVRREPVLVPAPPHFEPERDHTVCRN